MILGGTQSLHTNSFDEALGLPTEESATIALRTKQIIAYESEVADSIDPLAGSYYIEYLTDEIEKKVYEYLDKISEKGGMIKCIEDNFIQGEIENSAFDFQIELENQDRVVVGVNDFKASEEKEMPIQEIDPMLEKDQINRLSNLRKNRDNELVEKCLINLTKAAENNDNIMPYIVEAVRTYCTIGEMTSYEKVYSI